MRHLRKLRCRQQGPCWEHTCGKVCSSADFQDWSGMFGDRIKLIWGPWGQSRASGIQTGKLEAWEVTGPDKWVITLGGFWESNKLMACLPQRTWVVPPVLFLSHTHSHKDTHIPKSNSPGSNFIDPCKQDYALASVFLDRCRIHSTLQKMQSILLIRSQWCQREGYLALSSFCSQGGTDGSWPDCWLPDLYRSHEANLTHQSGVFQRGRYFNIHSLSQMEPKSPFQLGLTTWDPTKTQPSLNFSLRI